MSSDGKRRLIRRRVLSPWNSSNSRPQDAGGGAARLAAPPKLVKMDVMNSPEVSVVEPQSVPSRISVVLAEEVNVGGAQMVQRPLVDVETRPHVDNDPVDPDQGGLSDAMSEVCRMQFRSCLTGRLRCRWALPVVVQTRPQVGCDTDLPLPVCI